MFAHEMPRRYEAIPSRYEESGYREAEERERLA